MVNSDFHPSGGGKLSISLPAWGLVQCIHLCWVTGNTVPHDK